MTLNIIVKNKRSKGLCGLITILMAALTLFGSYQKADAQQQQTFRSPEEAVKSMVEAVKANNVTALSAIFGPEGKELISSGDAVADKTGRERFVKAYDEKHKLVKETDNKVTLIIGDNEWPFPIPIVKKDATWAFDTMAGKEELLNRRIGRNELSTIQVCLAYVDAQREYALKDMNGNGLNDYAQKFVSTEGKKDGLYWKTNEGEEPSPLGSLFAQATKEGYTVRKAGEKRQPYQGYYYRILKAQGKNAAGGAHDYVVKGKMIGGFALVAYPAEYGNSGVMTFIVNQDGIVYQKNLGKNTEKIVSAMTKYDPDKTWEKAQK
jgi:hypothetical protein